MDFSGKPGNDGQGKCRAGRGERRAGLPLRHSRTGGNPGFFSRFPGQAMEWVRP